MMLKVMPRITKDYQEGQCSICGSETLVRVLLNNKKSVSVCMHCLRKVGNLTVNELLAKYGEDINLNAS